MERRQKQFEEVRPDFEQYHEFIQANRFPISLLLDGVDDVRNVGAIFRLANGARLEKIYTYNSKIIRMDKQLKRVSRATEQFVPYEHLPDLTALQKLKMTKSLIGLEWTNDSILYMKYQLPKEGCVLVLGNEERGISQEVLDLLDACVHIPMYGIKTSLNVVVAAGIVVYDFLNRLM